MDTQHLQSTPAPEVEIKESTSQPAPRRSLEEVAQIKRIVSHGIFIKAYRVPAGIKLYSKQLDHPHVTILSKGSVLMHYADKKIKFVAPAHTEIPAQTRAFIMTLEESIWYCVHGTAETDLQKLIEMFG